MAPTTTLADALRGCIDPFKGLLILIVVADHNNVAHAQLPDVFRPLTFHVLGFLMLPFVASLPPLSRAFVADRIARYWIPHAFVLTLAAIAYWTLRRHGDAAGAVADYAAALATGTAPLVKRSSGFLAYWFLPTLLGIVIVLAAYRRLTGIARIAGLTAFVTGHAFLTAGNVPGWYLLPFGLAIVGNVFVLGLAFAALVRSPLVHRVRWLIPIVFVTAYAALAMRGTWLEVAVLELAPVTRVEDFVLQDFAGLAGVMTILLMAQAFARSSLLGSFGRHSLMIYLLHPLAYAALDALTAAAGWRSSSMALTVGYGVASYVFALCLSWGVSIVIARSPTLHAYITPRDVRSFGPVATFRSLAGRRHAAASAQREPAVPGPPPKNWSHHVD